MQKRIDQYRRLADDLAANRTSRRDFLKRASALGLSTPMMSALLGVTGSALTLAPKPSRADSHGDNQIVVASWGGGFGDAQRAAQFAPFTEETGIEVVLAPQQPEIALLQAQVESGNVEWDLSNNSFVGAYTLANKGLLEEIDYSAMNADIVDGINPLVRGKHSVGIYFWAMNLGYSLDYFTEAEHPTNWTEFWDVGRFPGPRGLTSMDFEPPPLEIPFLANGVAVDNLYPMDIDEGFELLSGFRDSITKWTGYSADATQLLVQGELAAAPGGNGSLTNAVKEGASVGMSWDQGLLYFDAWVMPKGAPHPENALRFVEFCFRPEVQAEFVERYPIGPVVAAATDLLPADVAEVSLGNPEHLALQVPPNPEWWSALNDEGKTNLELVYEKWATWIL